MQHAGADAARRLSPQLRLPPDSPEAMTFDFRISSKT